MEILIGAVGLIFVSVVMVAVGEKLGLPWPTLLTVVIAAAIFMPGLTPVEFPVDLVLPLFLPPLLWALARRTSWGVIRSQLTTVVSLSVLLVLATILAVAGSMMLLYPTLGVAAAVVIGAALAPPDPVAVDAVAETTVVPRRLTSTLQMEGLFNDAASIVTFHVALAALIAGDELSVAQGIWDFIVSVVLAVVVGIAGGFGAAKFSNWIHSTTARTALSWIVPFAVYLAAEEVHSSGVIAVVIAAVEMSSRLHIGAKDRLSGAAFWETVELVFTGLAFGLIGLSVRGAINKVGADLIHAVWVGFLISIVLIAVRFVWMFGFYKLNKHSPRSDIAPLRIKEVVMLTWCGMRGLVSLVLVLSIPGGVLINAHEVSVIALMVLLCTMVIPGMTLPWLLSKLDLASGPDAAGDEARRELMERARRASMRELYRHAEDLPPEFVDSIENWLDEETDADSDLPANIEAYKRAKAKKADGDEVGATDLLQERMAYAHAMKARANRIRVTALLAAQDTLLRARQVPGQDPVIVDEMLHKVDRMLVAANVEI